MRLGSTIIAFIFLILLLLEHVESSEKLKVKRGKGKKGKSSSKTRLIFDDDKETTITSSKNGDIIKPSFGTSKASDTSSSTQSPLPKDQQQPPTSEHSSIGDTDLVGQPDLLISMPSNSMEKEFTVDDFEFLQFKEYMEKNDFLRAQKVYAQGSDGSRKQCRQDLVSPGSARFIEMRKQCGQHLVSLGSARLVEMINGGDSWIKEWILGVIWVHGGQALIDDVFAGVKHDNRLLSYMARDNEELACNPDKFIPLLKMIKGYRKQAVKLAVGELLETNKVEQFIRLVSSLEHEPSLGASLADAAIGRGFERHLGLILRRSVLVKHYSDHPAFVVTIYSCAINMAYGFKDSEKWVLPWLVERADLEDLEAVKARYDFSSKSEEFRNAILDGLKESGRETRIGVRTRRDAVMKMVNEIVSVPTALNIISEYFYFKDEPKGKDDVAV